MDTDVFLAAVRSALLAVGAPRFFKNERGYQGEFNVRLRAHLPLGIVPATAIFEEEHQKTLIQHGIRIRPDLILHEPFDRATHRSRHEGNFVAIQLKRNASEGDARADIQALGASVDILNYELGIFINVASSRHHYALVPELHRERMVCFAVRLSRDGTVQVSEGN